MPDCAESHSRCRSGIPLMALPGSGRAWVTCARSFPLVATRRPLGHSLARQGQHLVFVTDHVETGVGNAPESNLTGLRHLKRRRRGFAAQPVSASVPANTSQISRMPVKRAPLAACWPIAFMRPPPKGPVHAPVSNITSVQIFHFVACRTMLAIRRRAPQNECWQSMPGSPPTLVCSTVD